MGLVPGLAHLSRLDGWFLGWMYTGMWRAAWTAQWSCGLAVRPSDMLAARLAAIGGCSGRVDGLPGPFWGQTVTCKFCALRDTDGIYFDSFWAVHSVVASSVD